MKANGMKVLIVDDHAIVRAGVRRLLSTLPDTEIFEASDGREAVSVYRSSHPDVVMLDLNLPGVGGLELLKRLLAIDTKPRIIIFSMHTESLFARKALQAGASGYISKNASPEEVLVAIKRVAEGDKYIENEIAQEMAVQGQSENNPLAQLNERDLEILRLLGEGRSLAEIAYALGVGYKTVANTSTQIKVKLGVARTADLIRLSNEMGLAK